MWDMASLHRVAVSTSLSSALYSLINQANNTWPLVWRSHWFHCHGRTMNYSYDVQRHNWLPVCLVDRCTMGEDRSCIALHCTYPLHLISNAIRVHTGFTGQSGISSLVLSDLCVCLVMHSRLHSLLSALQLLLSSMDLYINIIAGY